MSRGCSFEDSSLEHKDKDVPAFEIRRATSISFDAVWIRWIWSIDSGTIDTRRESTDSFFGCIRPNFGPGLNVSSLLDPELEFAEEDRD